MLQNKKIILAVTAGIAAYKTPHLVRLLVKKGAHVKVIMTPKAKEFVTPLSLATVSKNEVVWEFSDEDGNWNNHVALGLWADLMLVAPATANTLSKMATGQSNNLVLGTYLSAKCPVYFAPAMDLDMHEHVTTQENISQLQKNGNTLIPSESGELASGLVGKGRMAEPENIVNFLENHLQQNLPFYNKNVLISAGPTYERIDPVRFIGNFSSGKMGFALAERAANMGASVTLVSGPSALQTVNESIHRINVESAVEMQKAIQNYYEDQSIVIMAAAVADYKPKEFAEQKIKKSEQALSIELTKNPDILYGLGKIKKKQFLVGFALETNNEFAHAKGKLEKKNLDLIVLNSLQDKGAGFQKDTNKVTLITPIETIEFNTKPKSEVAQDILDFIKNQL